MENKDTLFDLPQAKGSEDKKLTCLSCKHRQRWECNSVVVQYCGVRKSNRTENGLLKIKCKDAACVAYEAETSETAKVFSRPPL
jgi:hypothetical protein